jgi:hypothetical protein
VAEDRADNSSNGKVTEIVVDKATQAFKLFSQGQQPIEVAIVLGLDRSETIRLYRDVWKLKRLYTLDCVYEQIGDEIKPCLFCYNIITNDCGVLRVSNSYPLQRFIEVGF